eukprot:8327691-Alexandrium_andersonii.AAC.1
MESTALPGEKNWKAWELNKLSAKQKRIAATFIYGEACLKVKTAMYHQARISAFQVTGILLTRAGKNDAFVTIE